MVSSLVSSGGLSRTASGEPFFNGFAWGFLNSAQGEAALNLARGGVLISFLRKSRFGFTMLLWVALLFFLANLDALGWIHSFINNLSVEIGLFMPISALGGYAISEIVGWLKERLPQRWRVAYSTSLAVLGVLAAGLAARQLIPILNPVTILARQADTPALVWIQEHIPQDETILINPFSWGYGLYAGNDGGYWITPIAGQRTVPPAVIVGFDTRRERVSRTNQLSKRVIELSADPAGLHTFLNNEGIYYIYIGARGGVLSPARLQSSELFEVLYHKEGTWVFQVK
jgi:hypothetical protein